MDDGLYKGGVELLPMHHGLYSSTSAPWVMDCTVIYLPPMGDGLYSNTLIPWMMGCTVVHLPHG